MANLVRDLQFGLRMLVKQPMMSTISILALALGIGLTVTMYSIVHGAMRPLPIEEPWEIVNLERENVARGDTEMGVTQHEYLEWRDQQTSFEDLAGLYQGTVTLSGSERPIRYDGAFMSAQAFTLLGAQPLLGRPILEQDTRPGAPAVILLGYETWQNDFQGDPGVIGREARINAEPGTIIGVMPEGFKFPMAEEAWVPLRIDLANLERGAGTWLMVIGRLRDGVDIETALEEMNTIAARIEADWPELNEGISVSAEPYTREYLDTDVLAMLWTMQGGVLMVLLIACANVANLLLSRAFDRSKEVAVRAALGAGRWRIVSQFLAEVFVLAAIGGLLGLGIARVGVALFNAQLATIPTPYWISVRIDWVVLGATTLLVFGASLVAGIAPALKVSGSDLHDVLKDESRGSSGFRMGRITRALVVAEVALSCALLVGAGLMIKSVSQLSNFEYGFPTDVFTARIGLFEAEYPTVEERSSFFEELQRRLQELPGVQGAALADALPASDRASRPRASVDGVSYASLEDHPRVNLAVITPGFFDTFDVELLDGRDFNALDTADSLPVTIVNRSLVERLFPGENPLGHRIKLGTDDDDGEPWFTIVGVAPDLVMQGLNSGDDPAQGFYLPLAQRDRRFMSLAARASGDSMSLAGQVRDAVASINADLPIYWVRPLSAEIHESTWFFSVFGTLFAVFGGAALFLAVLGLYGVMSFAARRRTQEMGIRLALGARPGSVLGMVMRGGFWQVGLGLTIGLGLGMLLASGLEMMLFQVDPRDLGVYALVVLALGLTGLIASLLPASRAARTDPIVALRT